MKTDAKGNFDTVTADLNYRAYRRAYDNGHEDYVKRANKNSDFYLSEQWAAEDLAALGSRPALTSNVIQLAVDTIKGHYYTTQADFTFRPKGVTTDEQASLLYRTFASILYANKYHKIVEPQVFEDGLIEERGYFDVRLDFTDNIYGDCRIRARDPKKIVLDPDADEYDPTTWTEVTYTDWFSIDTIEATYGKAKADEVRAFAQYEKTYGQDSVRFSGETDTTPESDVSQERAIRSIRVIERQHRKLSMVREFVEPTTGETRPVPESWDEERVQNAVKNYGLFLRKRLQSRIRWTVTADHITLHDDWSIYDEFTIVPYFPIFRRGRPSGYVTHLISPQEQLNKIDSQSLHIINSTANSGWAVEEGSLRNMTTDELETRGAETGLVLVYGKGRQPPAKIPPNQIPTGLEHAAQKAAGQLRELTRVQTLITPPNSEVSGVTLQTAKASALTSIQPFLQNLGISRHLLAQRVISIIQRFYTEPRLIRYVDMNDPKMASEEFYVNIQDAAGGIINNLTLGEYDIVVSDAPARDTFEDSQFAESIQLREAGITIPDHRVIQYSHLADKREIVEEVKQITGFAQPSEEEMQRQAVEEELLMRQAEATVSELEARAVKLQADAALSQAKAGVMISEEQRNAAQAAADLQQNVAKLRADLMKFSANLKNKVELAQRHIDAKKQLTQFTTMSKLIQESVKPKPQPAKSNGKRP